MVPTLRRIFLLPFSGIKQFVNCFDHYSGLPTYRLASVCRRSRTLIHYSSNLERLLCNFRRRNSFWANLLQLSLFLSVIADFPMQSRTVRSPVLIQLVQLLLRIKQKIVPIGNQRSQRILLSFLLLLRPRPQLFAAHRR